MDRVVPPTLDLRLGAHPKRGGSAEPHGPDALPVLFVAAPVMGAAFAIFLPFIGFAMPAYALGRGIFGKGRERTVDTGAVRA